MMQGVGRPFTGPDLVRAFDDLGQLLQQSQKEVLQVAEKLLRVGAQQAVQDSAVGNQVDLTA